jgi:hypothetical protein
MRGKTPAPEEKDTVADASQTDFDAAESTLTDLEIVFLQDVVECPDSGVAARYQRLGLSARQGHKLKTKLLEQGIIQEQLETTYAGRRMTVRLTEKAEHLLSQARKAVPG